MHVEFKDITLSRFRSFEKESTFTFGHAGAGLYFLKGQNQAEVSLGPNDVGKSTIIDALLWCLYGRTVMGLRNPDVVPWDGKGQTSVQVAIQVDKETHFIKRTVGPNLLTVDGAEVGQNYVAELIGIPYEILPFTVILGQRQPLFFDQTASDKLKIFSECLRLMRWEERSDVALMRANGYQNDITVKQLQIEAARSSIKDLKEDIQSAKAKKELWERQRQATLETYATEKENIEDSLQVLQADHDYQDLALERAETELRGSKYNEYQQQATARQIEINKLTAETTSLIREKSRLESDFNKADDALCPTCGQQLETSFRKNLLKELKTSINQYETNIKVKGELVEKNKETRDQLLERAQNEEAAVKAFRETADNARDMLLRYTRSIAEQQAKLQSLNASTAEYENQDNPHREQLTVLKSRLAQAEQRIEQAEQDIAVLTADHERAKFWVKGFKDIKLLTIEDILQELDLVTRGMLDEIGLGHWRVTYDIERETKSGTIAKGLHVFVENRNTRGPVKWECWGGGVSQRLRIVGSCALASVLLNHIGVTTNLMLFDEPTESLSQEGIDDLVDLLANLAKDWKKNVWMIDHHVMESSRFVDVVTVIKDQHGSRISQ